MKPGQSLTLERNPDYWARDLPVMRGLYNFDEIRIDYYRDASAMFEAFKAGLIDFRVEDDAARWLSGYDFPAAREKRIVKDRGRLCAAQGRRGFCFQYAALAVRHLEIRQAIASMFDFEWINAKLYGGLYRRSIGFFDGSELSSVGRPENAAERELLESFPGAVSEAAMEGDQRPPVSDGSGRDREIARKALAQLRTPVSRLRGGALVDASGRPLAFEILVKNREEERLALAYSAFAGPHRRFRRACDWSTKRSFSGAARKLRLRHDHRLVDRDALAGRRAARPLEFGGGVGRAPITSRRRSRAIDAMIAALLAARVVRGFCRGGARARSAADLGVLHRSAYSTRPSSGSRIGRSSGGRSAHRCSASISLILVALAAVAGAGCGAVARLAARGCATAGRPYILTVAAPRRV